MLISDSEFYPEKQALRIVKSVLKEKDISLIERIPVKNKIDPLKTIALYKFSVNADKIFFVAFTQAKGRYESFDYLLSVTGNFEVEKIRILKYRSEYGGEIASKRWLQQFEKYSSGELRYKKEISALSGATISATSLVADIPKVLKIIKDSCN
jgi:hypothetical protein